MTDNGAFRLIEFTDGWAVYWPDIKPVVEKATGLKLMKVLFDDLKCFEIGLGVSYGSGTNVGREVLWINCSTYWQDQRDEYFQFLLNRYDIYGVQFKKKSEAEAFYDYLEKKLSWWYLSHAE